LYLHSKASRHVTVVPLPVSTSMNRAAVLTFGSQVGLRSFSHVPVGRT